MNPFYAAAAPSYSPTSKPHPSSPLFDQEGWHSLQMVIFTRYLQCDLNALPSGGQIPKTDDSTIHVVSTKVQKSNIVAVCVCPGLSRLDAIAPLLNAVRDVINLYSALSPSFSLGLDRLCHNLCNAPRVYGILLNNPGDILLIGTYPLCWRVLEFT